MTNRVCLHESVHAVAALALGFDVVCVDVLEYGGLDGHTEVLPPVGWHYVCGHWRPNLDDPQLYDRVTRWLGWLTAPSFAQLSFGADTGCVLDHDLAWSLLAEVEPDEMVQRRVMAAISEQMRGLVARYERLIVDLAEVLFRRKRLGRAELLDQILTIQAVGHG